MGLNTKVEWADHSWGPWRGCTPVSAGCRNCYAARGMKRWGHDPSKVVRSADKTFNLPLAKKQDGSWKIPSGSLVFVCSWSDFFHEDAQQWIGKALDIMDARQDLTFLLLTKRADRMRKWAAAWNVIYGPARGHMGAHIWLGVTAENQEMADERIPTLLEIDWPGKKFVSVEPMLGPVDLDRGWLWPAMTGKIDAPFEPFTTEPGIDWVICGGESGPDNRAINADWVRSLRDQCVEADVPFFLKQYSAVRPAHMPKLDGKVWAEKPKVKGGRR